MKYPSPLYLRQSAAILQDSSSSSPSFFSLSSRFTHILNTYPRTQPLSLFAACAQAQRKKDEPARDATLTVTGAVGWRRPGIKYKKNELYMDTIEQVNVLMSSNGRYSSWAGLGACSPCSAAAF